MTELYDIHLFDIATGRYSGTQNCQLSYNTELYDSTTIAPPRVDKQDNQWWNPINWPYWTGSGWELRDIEE